MFLFRLIALVFIVIALMVLGYDVLTSLGAGAADAGFQMTSLSSVWGLVHGGSLAGFDNFIANTAPDFAKGAIAMIMGWPAIAVSGGFGLVLAVLFRRRGYRD